MTSVQDLVKPLSCRILCGNDLEGRSITGGYACDLLSWVISHIQTGEVWMTILNSVNVIAVAVLSECGCILLTEDVDMAEDVLTRAREKGITVLSTPFSTYDASAILSTLVN